MASSNSIVIDDEFVVRNTNPPPTIPECSVAQYLSEKMSEWSEFIGLEDGLTGEQLTYGEWYRQSKIWTTSLIQLGLKKDDLVLLFADNSIQYAVSMMAVVWMGLVFSPVTPANGQFELTQQIKDSKGSVLILDLKRVPILISAMSNKQYRPVICDCLRLIIVLNCSDNEEFFCKLAEIVTSVQKSTILVKTFQQLMLRQSEQEKQLERIPYFAVNSEDFFMIIYTSGTTGLPKGAVYSNYSTMACLMNFSKSGKFAKSILWYPFGHASGTMILLCNIAKGAHTVLFSDASLSPILRYAEKHQLPSITVSPEHVIQMALNDYHLEYDLSNIKSIACGGSKVSPHHISLIKQKYKANFIEGFGATEFMGPTVDQDWIRGLSQIGNVGQPVPGVEMKIVDLDTGKNLPSNNPGEICMRGAQRFVQYLRNEKATKAAIDADGWYRFGDIGYYDDTGSLFIVDRIKELVKFREWSIHPVEIEDFMLRHEAVSNVCVVGVKHCTDMSWLRAYVQVRDGFAVSEQELLKLVEDNMGFQKRLRAGIRFVDGMPRTAIGKIDRKHFHDLVKDEILTESIS